MAALVLAVLTWSAWTHVSWPGIRDALVGAEIRYVCAMIAAWSLLFVVRPARLLFLIRAARPQAGPAPVHIFVAHLLSVATNNVVPMRGGEALLVVLLRRFGHIRGGQALSVIVVDRVADLGMAALLFVLGLAWLPVLPAWAGDAIRLLALLCFAGLAAFAYLALRHRRILAVGRLLVRRMRSRQSNRWVQALRGLLSGVLAIRDPSVLVPLAAYTTAVWGITSASYWFGLRAFWPDVPLAATILTAGAIALSFVVPVTPGGIGIFHAVAVIVLAPFGIPTASALAFALVAHGIPFVLVLLAAGVAVLAGVAPLPARPAGQSLE
jgi:uncharacterized protein (TIRG00374 family)